MKISKLEFKGLGSFEGKVTIPFTDLSLVLLKGKNGCGKSVILDTVSWILFDETLRELKKDVWVNDTTNKGYGKLTLTESHGNTLEILRERNKKGRVDITVTEAGKVVSPKDYQEAQTYIEKRLGFDFTIFKNSIMFGQGDILSFAVGTDKQRKEIIGSILGFDEIDVCLKRLREKSGLLEKDRSSKFVSYNYIVDEIAAIEKMKGCSAEAILGLTEESKTVKAYYDALQFKITKLEEQYQMLWEVNKVKEEKAILLGVVAIEPEYLEKQKLAHAKKKELEETSLAFDAKNKEHGEHYTVYLEKRSEAEFTRKTFLAKQQIRDQVLGIAGDCPTCTQPLPVDKKDSIVADLEKEIQELTNTCKEQDKISNLYGLEQEGLAKQKLVLLNSVSRLSAELSIKVFSELESTRIRIETAKKRLVVLDIVDLSPSDSSLEELTAEKNELKRSSTILLSETLEREKRINEIRTALTRKRSLSLKVDDIAEDLVKVDVQLKHCVYLENLLSLKGVRNRILEDLFPFLEERVNSFLSVLLPNFEITFSTGTKNDLVIMIKDVDVNKVRSFQAWSGGQKLLLSVALRFGLWELTKLFSQKHLEVLFLDEIFSCLDPENRDVMFTFLKDQQARLKMPLLVVEHLEDIQDLFDQTIAVAMDDKKNSTITSINL